MNGLIDIKDRLNEMIDPNEEARNAFLIGVARGKGGDISGSASLTVGSTADYKYEVNYGGSPFNLTSAIEWVTSNPSVATMNGKTLTAISAGTTKVRATIFDNVIIDEMIVTVSATTGGPIGGGPGGGSGGTTPPTPPTAPSEIGQTISDMSSSINGATGEEIIKLLDEKLDSLITTASALTDSGQKEQSSNQIVELLNKALVKINQVDLSNQVQVSGNQATLTIHASASLTEAIAQAKAKLEEFANKIKDLGAEVQLEARFTVNVKTDQDANQLTVDQNLLKSLNKNGLTKLELKVNEQVEVAFDVSTFKGSASIAIEKAPADTVTQVTGKLASSVYSFSFKDSDTAVYQFTQPIDLAFAVNINGVDPELLTLVHIDGDRQEYVGGKIGADGLFHGQATNFSSYAVVENKIAFSDLASVQTWAGRQIEVMAAKGVLTGKGDGQFDPKGNVTRAEFAKMLVMTFGLQNSGNSSTFKDVKTDAWYATYVSTATSSGIINGYADGTFKPNAPITRAEMATMAARALKVALHAKSVTKADDFLGIFQDAAKVNETMKADVALAIKKGIIQGVGEGLLDPNGTSNRAQAAVIIYRMFNLK